MYDDRESSIQGADYTYVATVSVSSADPLTKAYLTFKASPNDADPGALQKTVTTVNSVGVGQITNDGSTNGLATVLFTISAGDSAALTPRDYYWDVKVKTVSTALAYAAGGIWHFYQNVTDAA